MHVVNTVVIDGISPARVAGTLVLVLVVMVVMVLVAAVTQKNATQCCVVWCGKVGCNVLWYGVM